MYVYPTRTHSQYKVQRIIFIVFLPLALVDVKNKTRHGCPRAEICSHFVGFPLIEIITKIYILRWPHVHTLTDEEMTHGIYLTGIKTRGRMDGNLGRDSNPSTMLPGVARPPDKGSIKVMTFEWLEGLAWDKCRVHDFPNSCVFLSFVKVILVVFIRVSITFMFAYGSQIQKSSHCTR
jgi:hypothetical protein